MMAWARQEAPSRLEIENELWPVTGKSGFGSTMSPRPSSQARVSRLASGVERQASGVIQASGVRSTPETRMQKCTGTTESDTEQVWVVDSKSRRRKGKKKKKWWPPLASIRPKLFASLLAPFLVGDGLLAGGSMTIRFRLHCFFPIQIHGCGEQTSYICHVATMPDNSAARAETALFVLGLLLRGRRREGVTLVG